VAGGGGGFGGGRVAVELGSEGHVQASLWGQQVVGLEVVALPTAVDALWLVGQGEVDTAVVDHVTARHYLRDAPQQGLRLQPNPITVEPYAVVVRARDKRLLNEVNGALRQLQQSGALDRLVGRWLD
jgi:arginine/lysine/histidine transporter system substrate-binding protein